MLHTIAKNRIQAGLIHLLISAAIALTIIFAAIWIWYPGNFIHATGAKKIFIMIVAIDVCLGPFLTIIIFNKKKKELARDLAIIFILQIAALTYGIYTVAAARPVYAVFAVDRFELVQANEISVKNLNLAINKRFKSLPLFKPQWISALLPEDIEESNDLLFGAIDTGSDLAQQPRYYHDYSKSVDEIIRRAKPLEELRVFNNENIKLLDQLISQYPNTERYAFLPMTAKTQHLTVIIDKSDGSAIETVLLQPW